MNGRETRRYDMVGRGKTFGTENTADFADGGEGKKRFANLTQAIADLDVEKAKQQGGADTAREVQLDALRLDIQNIARTARAIAQDAPGFADDFRTPDSASQADLITTADAYILRLADQPADCIKHYDNRRSDCPIAWESEAWIAEDPNHMIHFNGERFHGPYPDVMPTKSPGSVAQMKSRALATLRDTLLPKLLSGELSVSDTEQIEGRIA